MDARELTNGLHNPRPVDPQLVIDVVAKYYHVDQDRLKGSREANAIKARRTVIYLYRQLCRWLSSSQIGRIMDLDHSSVLVTKKHFPPTGEWAEEVEDIMSYITELHDQRRGVEWL